MRGPFKETRLEKWVFAAATCPSRHLLSMGMLVVRQRILPTLLPASVRQTASKWPFGSGH